MNKMVSAKQAFLFPDRKIRLATSFSGIGAIEQAFKRLGLNFEIQFAGDIDEYCKKTYFANYDITEEKWHSDIHDFDATHYRGKVDLFVGGAPCQAFSLRGKHGGFSDTRGTLFREFARVVIESQPKVFIFENVPGMLSHDKGNTWDVIKTTFEKDCGYDIHYAVLNAKDYGIPQSRDRLYCIGFKVKTDFDFPQKQSLKKKVFDFLEAKVDKKYFLKIKGVNFVTRAINIKKRYTQVNGDILLCEKRNQQFNWHGDFIYHNLSSDIDVTKLRDYIFNPNDFETQYYLENLTDKYALNKDSELTFRYMNRDGCSISKTPGVFRKLTPRECLSLMGFSKNFKMPVSDTELYKQAGNSIVVDVLMAILKKMDITKYGE